MSSYPVSRSHDYSFTFLLRLLSSSSRMLPQTAGRLKITFLRVIRSLNRITVLGLTIRFSRCCALCPRLTSVPLSATAWLLYLSQQQMSSVFLKNLCFFYFSIFSFICLSFFDYSLCFFPCFLCIFIFILYKISNSCHISADLCVVFDFVSLVDYALVMLVSILYN